MARRSSTGCGMQNELNARGIPGLRQLENKRLLSIYSSLFREHNDQPFCPDFLI
jgi:hypothetical protein